jgi:aspartyl-tRNA(Asn)/glutamyl-tRNA(Gln) amidotransferase subunit B
MDALDGTFGFLYQAFVLEPTVSMSTVYETVVGLEVHAQLLTQTKTFCGCQTSFGSPPNTHVCPVCLGLPGSLPVLNRTAVDLAIRAALGVHATVQTTSIFARKNYFYPDLPKGYQISQFDLPLATEGYLDIADETVPAKRAGIIRVHMEEDAGKTLHHSGNDSVVDLNRAGTPLIEIVGAPDLCSGAEAACYLRILRDLLMFLGVNDGNLEQGSFRCDANVSIRPKGSDVLGTRCEIKNVNSFRFVQKAIDYEAKRQQVLLESGQRIVQETRGWNEKEGKTYSMRSKEDAHDYRYFPEPDLPPLVVSEQQVAAIRDNLPATPEQRRMKYVEEYGLPVQAAEVLTGHPQIAVFFEQTLVAGIQPRKAANFIQSEILAHAQTDGLGATFPITATQLIELLTLVEQGTISGKQAKEVYAAIQQTSDSPKAYVEQHGMAVQSNTAELEALCQSLVEKNPKQVESYRQGKTNLLGFFVGQVMKATKGSADPKLVNEILVRLLQ